MKIGLLTDLHFGLKKANKIIWEWQLSAFKVAMAYFRENKVDIIVFFGDLFDNRHSNTTWMMNTVKDNIAYELNNFETYMILGNHDIYYKDSLECNILDIIFEDRFKNIKIIKKPTEFPKYGFSICPWVVDPEELSKIEKFNTDYLFGHFEVTGGIMVNGVPPCKHGVDPKIFNRFKHVYSGHFHLKQDFGNVSYLGTMMPLTWAEYGSIHGIHILDTKTGKLDFKELDISMFDEIHWTGQPIDVVKYDNKIIKLFVKSADPVELEKFISELSKYAYTFSTIFPTRDIEDEELEVEMFSEKELFNKYIEKHLPENLDENKFRKFYEIFKRKCENGVN